MNVHQAVIRARCECSRSDTTIEIYTPDESDIERARELAERIARDHSVAEGHVTETTVHRPPNANRYD